jgi:uncharacterized membrane protein
VGKVNSLSHLPLILVISTVILGIIGLTLYYIGHKYEDKNYRKDDEVKELIAILMLLVPLLVSIFVETVARFSHSGGL